MNMIEQIMKDPENVLLTSDTVEHAIDVVLSRCISTCPVTTPSGEFLGQITDATLIKAVVLKSSGKKIKTINDLKGMYIKSQTISKTGTLSHLITKVFKSRSQRVFVVDSRKKLLGLVSPKDFLMFLTNELGFDLSHPKVGADSKDAAEFASNIEKLREQAKIANLKKEVVAEMFGDVPNLFLTFDSKFNLTYANKFAQRVLGFKSKDMSGQNVSSIFLPNSRSQIQQLVANYKKANKNKFKRGYYSIQNIDGHERRYEMSINIGISADGELWVSCLGRPLDADLLLRHLNGVYASI